MGYTWVTATYKQLNFGSQETHLDDNIPRLMRDTRSPSYLTVLENNKEYFYILARVTLMGNLLRDTMTYH